ncbi:MAG: hypothetical protein FJZ01_21195 [Candidatus Sericytochromatia bacterium]|nr:hypothetical protein [Candidatus Tanganyikabacteria bacterium]
MPRKRSISAALAVSVAAGVLAAPAFAQQRQAPARDERPNVMQPAERAKAQNLELKGPAGEAVGHLKEAYSELAKAHASVVAGKMDDAQDSLGKTRRKLEDAGKVRGVPEHIKTMSDGLRKRVQELEATLPGRDLNIAAQETDEVVRAMARDMTGLVAIERPAGGGGGPDQPRMREKKQEDEKMRRQQEQQPPRQ